MGIKFANSAFATLAAGINSSATSITLTTGQGARFPSLGAGDYFYATLIDASNNLEIVKCTARSTDVLTVTRAQEGTTARSFSTGDRIELRITAAGIAESANELVASGTLVIPGTSSSGAILRLSEDTDNGTNYIGLKSPAAVASNLDFTLPSTDGSAGQFMKTDGSGVLSFGTITQKLLNYTVLTDSTRAAPSLTPGSTARVVQFSKSYTKLSSTSDLLFQVNLSGKASAAGALQMVCQYGSSAEGIGITYNYTGGTWLLTASGFYLLTGHTTTGAQNFTVSNYAANSQAGNGWATVVNPNSSDDSRMNQMQSNVTVWELE